VAAFGAFLDKDPDNWGEGLSLDTIEAIRRAGIERMWIGMGDWEGGLWHPATVRAAVDAGYLIGPYDSYETAIAPGLRPDWITAQLGKAAFETCGVIRKDGSVTAGFQKAGVYTNMSCMLPLLKARVQAIAAAVPFNSWFIDVTASGMVFDDYRVGRKTSMRENAAANVGADRWLSEAMRFPIGSEDGRAVTSGGISFAHGTETPVIGWGDPDLQKDTSSPFFLGIWHPPTQPSIFFKPVPMKEPYRTLHFAPENRLPLYQAVFHGSIISSHHWGYDNLKLTNVAEERELAQLLYNVAPLFHLSTDSLDARLAAIHRQYAFFRATHEALAKLSLDRFEWLSDDRLIQQTIFADGSRLIANFGASAYDNDGEVLPPKSVVARLAGGATLSYKL
jgi:hypothetical protein